MLNLVKSGQKKPNSEFHRATVGGLLKLSLVIHTSVIKKLKDSIEKKSFLSFEVDCRKRAAYARKEILIGMPTSTVAFDNWVTGRHGVGTHMAEF